MNKAMNSSAITTSSKIWQKLPWFLMFFFLSTTFTLNFASSSATTLPSYKDHCASTNPEPEHSSQKASRGSLPLARSHDGYYTGGTPFLNPKLSRSFGFYSGSTFLNSMSFRTMAVHAATGAKNLFKVEGSLTFQGVNTYNQDDSSCRNGCHKYYSGGVNVLYGGRGDDRSNSMTFSLSGFWSESSGNLCMVGSGSAYSKEGNQLNLAAVLKLHNITKNTNITSLITGTLESLSSSASDPDHFEPISILMLPQYTSLSTDFSNGDSGGRDNIPPGLSLSSLPPKTFCSIGYRAVDQFNLKYSRGCNSTKKCSPFDHAGIGYVPRVMSLYKIQCSEEDEMLRVLVEFPEGRYVSDSRSFNPNTTLVGEGSWDEKKNQLFIVACRFLGTTESLANAYLGDCSTKLIFRFPKIWSINDSGNILGRIWSNKTVKEPGYFYTIKLRSSKNFIVGVPELKYEYTKMDTGRKLCSASDTKAIKWKRYPDAFSINMKFDILMIHSKRVVTGYAEPLFVGERFYEYTTDFSHSTDYEVPENLSVSSPVNISYRIDLTLFGGGGGISPLNSSSPYNSSSYERWEFLAEGIYDAETGRLCMVGCRNVVSDTQIPIDDPKDCDNLIKFQFPPLNSRNPGKIKGSITGARNEIDPLYLQQGSLHRNYMSKVKDLSTSHRNLILVPTYYNDIRVKL